MEVTVPTEHTDEHLADTLNLSLPPSSSCLPDLRRSVARTLEGVDEEVVADVLLALDEAVSNAIRHGSRAGDPVLVVKADGEWIEMSVHDSGPTPRLPAEPPPSTADRRPPG